MYLNLASVDSVSPKVVLVGVVGSWLFLFLSVDVDIPEFREESLPNPRVSEGSSVNSVDVSSVPVDWSIFPKLRKLDGLYLIR